MTWLWDNITFYPTPYLIDTMDITWYKDSQSMKLITNFCLLWMHAGYLFPCPLYAFTV